MIGGDKVALVIGARVTFGVQFVSAKLRGLVEAVPWRREVRMGFSDLLCSQGATTPCSSRHACLRTSFVQPSHAIGCCLIQKLFKSWVHAAAGRKVNSLGW